MTVSMGCERNSRTALEIHYLSLEHCHSEALSSFQVEGEQSRAVSPSGFLWLQIMPAILRESRQVVSWSSLVADEWKARIEQAHRNRHAIELLRSWRRGDKRDQEDTWLYLRKALDEHRLSDRKLFNAHD